MNLNNMRELLEEITDIGERVAWVLLSENELASLREHDPNALVYEGRLNGWRLLVIGVTHQGVEVRDGTATHASRGLIVRLTPELSCSFFQRAKEVA